MVVGMGWVTGFPWGWWHPLRTTASEFAVGGEMVWSFDGCTGVKDLPDHTANCFRGVVPIVGESPPLPPLPLVL